MLAFATFRTDLTAQDERTRKIASVGGRRPVREKLEPTDPDEYDFGEYHALLIGIQEYLPPIDKLESPHKDVTELARVLVEHYGFVEPRVLLTEQATREGILRELDSLSLELGPDDNLLIYFAGHGYRMWDFDERSKQGYWIPYLPPGTDNGWWSWVWADTIKAATARIPAQHILLISDSCYAGDLKSRGHGVSVQQRLVPARIRMLHGSSSNHVFLSGNDKAVPDSGHDGHSNFAYHLIDALRSSSDRFLNASALVHEVKLRVERDGRQQPIYAEHPQDPRQSGELVFVRQTLGAGASLVDAQVPGLPPGYRCPSGIVPEPNEAGDFRFWSEEDGERVEMVLVHAGTFERDGETVTIEPFLIDRFEVSVARFERWVKATGQSYREPPARRYRDADMPVTGIWLDEARAFATWSNKQLPTIDEWLAAAALRPGAGRLSRFPWGDEPAVPPLPPLARPAAVGAFGQDRSPAGAMGMGGSVRELCEPDDAARRAAEPRYALCGGTQVLVAKVDASVSGTPVFRDGRTRLEEAVEGFRCIKRLIPPRAR